MADKSADQTMSDGEFETPPEATPVKDPAPNLMANDVSVPESVGDSVSDVLSDSTPDSVSDPVKVKAEPEEMRMASGYESGPRAGGDHYKQAMLSVEEIENENKKLKAEYETLCAQLKQHTLEEQEEDRLITEAMEKKDNLMYEIKTLERAKKKLTEQNDMFEKMLSSDNNEFATKCKTIQDQLLKLLLDTKVHLKGLEDGFKPKGDRVDVATDTKDLTTERKVNQQKLLAVLNEVESVYKEKLKKKEKQDKEKKRGGKSRVKIEAVKDSDDGSEDEEHEEVDVETEDDDEGSAPKGKDKLKKMEKMERELARLRREVAESKKQKSTPKSASRGRDKPFRGRGGRGVSRASTSSRATSPPDSEPETSSSSSARPNTPHSGSVASKLSTNSKRKPFVQNDEDSGPKKARRVLRPPRK